MQSSAERALGVLVLVNLTLQLFDGVLTYVGLQVGFGESNPLIAWAIGALGPGSALVLVKLEACACLMAVWQLRRSRLAAPALALTAAIYVACSLAPWAAALASVHFT